MTKFTDKEIILLEQCAPTLQLIFKTAKEIYEPLYILPSTIRTEEEQKKFVAEGKGKTLNSMHLKRVCKICGGKAYSFAVDAAPLVEGKIDWIDIAEFSRMAGTILAVADILYKQGKIKYRLRWGGDWNGNNKTLDERLKDYCHFEIKLK